MTLHLSSGGRSSQMRALEGIDIKQLSLTCALVVLVSVLSFACTIDERQTGIPSKAQETINAFTEDFSAGLFDKIYREADGEWRSRVTLEESNETFRRLKERLGAIRERAFISGRQQQNQSGNPPGNSLVVSYNTKFERAEAIETFTLIERDGRYLLAGYSVSSNMLNQ